MRDLLPAEVRLRRHLTSQILGAFERYGYEQVETPAGLDWPFIPARFVVEPRGQMPNWSHGLAGAAGSLAAAGVALERDELVETARRGAEHLVTLADVSDGGMNGTNGESMGLGLT